MPFNPNEPQNGEIVDADFLRSQLNALHAEATASETDPVFAASEAACCSGRATRTDSTAR